MIPSDWEVRFILNLYKGKGEALDHGNYCGLKLTDKVMKLLEQGLDYYIREIVNIDEMQFGFVPSRGTISIVPQQQKFITTNKISLVCLYRHRKSLRLCTTKILRWTLQGLRVEECVVCVI